MRSFWRLFRYTKGFRLGLLGGIVLKSLEHLVSTFFTARLVSGGVVMAQRGELSGILHLFLTVMPWIGLVMLFHISGEYIVDRTCQCSAARIRMALLEKILNSNGETFNQASKEDVITIFSNDIQRAFNTLIQVIQVPVNVISLGLGGLCVILKMHWGLALFVLAVGVCQLLYGMLLAGKMRNIADALLVARGKTNLWLQAMLDGIIPGRMDGMLPMIREQYRDAYEEEERRAVQYGSFSGIIGGLNNMNGQLLEKGSTYIAGTIASAGELSIGQVVEVSQISSNVASVWNVSRILTDTQIALACMEKIFALMDALEAEQDGEIRNLSKSPVISFENVSFQYRSGAVVWEHANFNMSVGYIYALWGESGSGKTTLMRLIMAIYKPTSGRMMVNGVETKNWDKKALRRLIAYVPQTPIFFQGTIEENLMLGLEDETVDNDRLIWAVREAQIEEIIERLPEGYKTQIVNGDGRFSGGQLQRLAFARALYRQAPILLLDEPTAALDRDNEQKVYQCLKRYKQNHLIIIATHRKPVLEIADFMIKVSGRKVELSKI